MDIILPIRAKLQFNSQDQDTTYKHYKLSPQHHIKDLDVTIKIIHELYPEFDKYVKKAIFGHETYFLNMYIMKKKYFFEYMNWLFPILKKFHEQKDYSNDSVFEIRTPGLIAERLVAIFMFYLKDKYKNLKVKETQNTFFIDCDNAYYKPKYENKIGICMASDNNYAKHLGVALQSLIENSSNKHNYDIVIFDNKLTHNNKTLLSRMIEGHENFSLRFLKTSDYVEHKKLFEKNHINKSCYLRFAILDLLRNYNKVIYLDCDLIVNRDIAELYNIDLKKNYVAAVRDSITAYWNHFDNDFGSGERKYNKEVLGLDDVYNQYFNSGVMIINIQEMSRKVSTDDLFKMAIGKEYHWQDQDILNKVCKGKVHYLDSNWNYMPHINRENPLLEEFSTPKYVWERFLNAKSKPYIIHFAGHFQPMYVSDVDCGDIYWNYARKSPFYEELLKDIFVQQLQPLQQHIAQLEKITFKVKIKQKLIKMFPNDTRRGRFLRKIYHKIKRRR